MVVFYFRLGIKESPRWLASKGHLGAAERIVDEIEAMAPKETLALLQPPETERFDTRQSRPTLTQVLEYVRRERMLSLICFVMAPRRSALVGHRLGHYPIEEALFLPRTIGEMLGFVTQQQAPYLIRNEAAIMSKTVPNIRATVIALVVLWRLRYKLSLRDLARCSWSAVSCSAMMPCGIGRRSPPRSPRRHLAN